MGSSRGQRRLEWRCCNFSCLVFWPLFKLPLRQSILALSLELLADKKLNPTSSHGRSLSSTSTSGLTIITLAGPPLLTAPTLCVQLTASQAGKRVGSRWSRELTTSTQSFPRTRSRRGRWRTICVPQRERNPVLVWHCLLGNDPMRTGKPPQRLHQRWLLQGLD